MNNLSKVLITHIASVSILVITACWYATSKDWEPAAGLIGSVVACIGSFAFLAQKLLQRESRKQIDDLGATGSARDCANSLHPLLASIASGQKVQGPDEARLKASALWCFLRGFGLAQIDKKGDLAPISERAQLFIKSLSLTAKHGFSFAGDWRAEGSQNAAAIQLGEILGRIENYRIQSSGGIQQAESVRTIASSLVIIKAVKGGEAAFLMRWSDAWGGYYWFLGGIQDESDVTPDVCAKREICEELGVPASIIQHLTLMLCVNDKRVSSRLHFLTTYQYNIFAAGIDESNAASSRIMHEEFEVTKAAPGGHTIRQKCKWMTWREISSSPELLRDASVILAGLERFGVQKVPLSVQQSLQSMRP